MFLSAETSLKEKLAVSKLVDEKNERSIYIYQEEKIDISQAYIISVRGKYRVTIKTLRFSL